MHPKEDNDTTRARQGVTVGRVRFVLAFSLSAAIVGLGLAWLVMR